MLSGTCDVEAVQAEAEAESLDHHDKGSFPTIHHVLYAGYRI